VGSSLIYLPSVVIVSAHFERRRALATGLAVCGTGVGTVVFAPFVESLLRVYGWRGTLLIEAGLLLNCCVCATVYIPPPPPPSTTLTTSSSLHHTVRNRLHRTRTHQRHVHTTHSVKGVIAFADLDHSGHARVRACVSI